jgi:hypothetical protein
VAEVGAFDGIEQIAAAAEGLSAAGGVAQRQEHAAAVAFEPEQRELATEPVAETAGPGEGAHVDGAVLAARQGVGRGLGNRQERDRKAQAGIVIE